MTRSSALSVHDSKVQCVSQVRKASQEFMGPGRQLRLVPQKLAAQVLPPPILKQIQASTVLQEGMGACSTPSLPQIVSRLF